MTCAVIAVPITLKEQVIFPCLSVCELIFEGVPSTVIPPKPFGPAMPVDVYKRQEEKRTRITSFQGEEKGGTKEPSLCHKKDPGAFVSEAPGLN